MIRRVYLVLAVAGFVAPSTIMLPYSVETGNWLYWLDPEATMVGMFANDVASAFVLDLLCAVIVFFVWTWHEARRLGMKHVWVYWVLTMLFGVAGPLPLFLYVREQRVRGAA